jgi:hypothetical protein
MQKAQAGNAENERPHNAVEQGYVLRERRDGTVLHFDADSLCTACSKIRFVRDVKVKEDAVSGSTKDR